MQELIIVSRTLLNTTSFTWQHDIKRHWFTILVYNCNRLKELSGFVNLRLQEETNGYVVFGKNAFLVMLRGDARYHEERKVCSCFIQCGTWNKKYLDTICKIYELRCISMRVKKEECWLRKEILIPNRQCSISKEDMDRYEDLIFNFADGHALLENNNFILTLQHGGKYVNYYL